MTTTQTEVERYAELAIEQAEVLVDTIEAGEVSLETAEHYGLDEGSDALDLLDVMALELYGNTRTYPNSDATVTHSVTVVTGIGGPHVEFTVNMSDDVMGEAFWGTDSAKDYGHFPGLFDWLIELIGIET